MEASDTTDLGVSDPRRSFADAPNRLTGYVVDAVLLTSLSFVGAMVVSLVFGPVVVVDLSADPAVRLDQGLALANAVLGTLISIAYFVGSWRRFEGSPGQRLLGMRLEVEAGDGRIGVGRGFVRWLFVGLPIAIQGVLTVYLSGWILVLGSLAVLGWFVSLLVSIARSATRQGWHDRVSKTIVSKPSIPIRQVAESAGEPTPDVR
jgi:hypothetical protein